MTKHRQKKISRAAVVSTAIAAAVGVGLTPTVADAATYVVGLPEWLPTGGLVNTLPSDPGAVTGAILNDRANTTGLKGWGFLPTYSEEDLAPQWVTWMNPLAPASSTTTSGGWSYFLGVPYKYTDASGTVTGSTHGQWVSPSDPGVDLTNLTGLSADDLLKYGNYLSGGGDALAALAPLTNWTAYLSNTNFIGYGDGAIAIGQGYQDFIDMARAGELEAGPALTGPRKIVITDANDPATQNVTKAYVKVGLLEYTGIQTAPGVWLLTKLDDGDYPDAPDMPTVEITPGGVIDVTLLTVNLLRNPGRPNGGLYARFAPIYEGLTGINPVTPERQDVLPEGMEGINLGAIIGGDGNVDLSGLSLDNVGNLVATVEGLDGKPVVLTILKTDFTWEYDLLSDAPVTANPIAWANSGMAALLPLTLGASLLDQSLPGMKVYTSPDGTLYGTLTQDELPLLAPAHLVAGLLGAATGEDINTPVADALEPLLRLLVDTSYTDAVRNPDGTWSRTLDQMHVPTLFGTQTINRTQAALLAGDIVRELGKGVGSEYTDVVTRVTNRVVSFLQDNDIQVPAELKAAAAKLATEPGTEIRMVSSTVGDDISKVLGALDAKLPADKAPTQKQLADVQRPIGKVLAVANDATGGEAFKAVTTALNDPISPVLKAGKQIETDVTKQVTKTQTSLTRAQARADKVNAELKKGNLKGAVKQVGANAQNRVERAKKDINNGLKKLKAATKPKAKKSESSD